MAEKIYIKGLRSFAPSANAPDFVLGTLVIDMRELVDWVTENPNYLTEYKEKKQLKVQMLKGKESVNFVLDTFKPTPNTGKKQEEFTPKKVEVEDLPF